MNVRIPMAAIMLLASACAGRTTPPTATQAAAGPSAGPSACPSEAPFWGAWTSSIDGASLELTATGGYHLRFPYDDAQRDIFADVVACDLERQRLTLRYTRVLQGGVPVPLPDHPMYMLYALENGRLFKWVTPDPEMSAFEPTEPFTRQSGR